jgi:hypothetical protein
LATRRGDQPPFWGNDETGINAVYRLGTGDTFGRNIWAVVPGGDSGSFRSRSADLDYSAPGVAIFLVRPIPEPSTALLLAFGLVGIAAGRRRRTRMEKNSLLRRQSPSDFRIE